MSHGTLKRSGDLLESSRPSPNAFLHRGVLSGTPRLDSPEMGSYAQLPVVYANPGTLPSKPLSYTDQRKDEGSTYTSPYLGENAVLPNLPPTVPYSPPTQPNLMRASQAFAPNPTPVYTTSPIGKAQLELTGDLSSMAKGWWVCLSVHC
jgi:hypothetical protein